MNKPMAIENKWQCAMLVVAVLRVDLIVQEF
jgi:hypothetical protein